MKKYYWLNNDSRLFLKRDYLESGVTPEQRIFEIAQNAEKILGINGFAEKFEDYMGRGFFSLATPVWTNFGNSRGLPVSCFGSYIPDTMEDIFSKLSEVGIMSKVGGGTSGYFGDLRHRGSPISVGGLSSGPIHFMELFDTAARVVNQGSARRGSFAAYLPIDHPDVEEFLLIRGEGHPIQNISIGLTITDEWMQSMVEGDKKKRSLWGKVIKKRFETGYPYLFFTDNVNNSAPQVYKDKGLRINASNLCSEIALSNNKDESFVCVLSSFNLLHWDEIKQTDAVETLIYFLDAVNEEFIQKTANMKFMDAAHRFAKNQRALGAGVLGWHSLLQSKNIAFESMQAKNLNVEIWKEIRSRADKASEDLAAKFGEPPLLQGYGRRNVTTLAVAPTTSSSFILGQVSSGIEVLNSNYFVKKMAKGNFTYKNPFLIDALKRHQKDTEDVWKSILLKGGSVQHLDFLTDHERDVFKTFSEVSQQEIVIQNIQRQKYIDQAVSLNLMIPSTIKPKDVSDLLIFGWQNGVKTFYYQRSSSPSQELVRSILTCKTCES